MFMAFQNLSFRDLNSTVLNSDWIYRKMLPGVLLPILNLINDFNKKFEQFVEFMFVTVKNIFANTMIKIKFLIEKLVKIL